MRSREQLAALADGDEAPQPETSRAAVGGPDTLPDFRGLSLREAIDLMRRQHLSLEPDIRGSGTIVAQEPAPGAKTQRLSKLRLILAASGKRVESPGDGHAAR